jgi:hypothetical protein
MENIHAYKLGERGRDLKVDLVNGTRQARMTCSHCNKPGGVNIIKLLPPDIIDKKFVQKGWKIDPHVCPECVANEKKARAVTKKERQEVNNVTPNKPNGTLATNPVLKAVSVDTHKATAKLHQLLVLNFDPDDGCYAEGWSDERVSKESGLSLAHVAEVRNIAYGELKEPEEIAALRKDIKALNDLIGETLVAAQKEVNALNKRVSEICIKLGVKM